MLSKKLLLPILIVVISGGALYLIKNPNEKEFFVKNNAQKNPGETEKINVFNPDSLIFKIANSSAPWANRDSHAALVFKNKIWLTGGLNGNGFVIKKGLVEYWKTPHFSDIWASDNGQDWKRMAEKSPWGNRRSIQLADFNGKMWLMGGWGPSVGYKNDVWYSKNGVNWTKAISNAAWPAREGHSLLVFKNKLWLIGGVNYDKKETKNDVWYSENGADWIEATSSADWSPRWDHAAATFKDKLWLIGGMDLKGRIFKDVWSSEDGKKWVLETDNPPWEARQGHNILDFQNKLWIIGRFNDILNGGNNDVWYSEDGINWQKTKEDPLWLGREDSSAVVFQDKIWILGGMDSNWEWKNDIWYSAF